MLNSITVQHLMGLYPAFCGMSGTLVSSEYELFHFYDLKTVVIPTNRESIRVDHPDLLFNHVSAKWDAIVADVIEEHGRGRPILIGTGSVEESEQLADRLKTAGIDCRVLNAKNDEQEAVVIAEAGAKGAVTVSTNMAGRGTDIKLGGKDETYRDAVAAVGGLYVIGAGRFESRRIDFQLRGRAGRQGDPGATRFYVSLEDPLMRKFNVAQWIPKNARQLNRKDAIDDAVIADKVALVQRICEGQNFDIRKTLYNYTSLIEKQRRIVQEERSRLVQRSPESRLDVLSPKRYEQYISEFGPRKPGTEAPKSQGNPEKTRGQTKPGRRKREKIRDSSAK